MKRSLVVNIGAQVVTRTIKAGFFVLTISFSAHGCSAESPPSDSAGRAIYNIPLSFDPEPGPSDRKTGTRRIEAPEFSFMMTEEALAKGVEGFEPGLNGISHDTMIIVRVFDPDIHGGWTPSGDVIKGQLEIWTMTGHMSTACMANEQEPLTGYYKYYTFCDPQPSGRSNFWLMDRVPNTNEPPPADKTYIKGVCRDLESIVRPEDGQFTRCKFSRKTDWNDQFSFWLKGENLRYLGEVEAFIESLLLEWKQSLSETAGS